MCNIRSDVIVYFEIIGAHIFRFQAYYSDCSHETFLENSTCSRIVFFDTFTISFQLEPIKFIAQQKTYASFVKNFNGFKRCSTKQLRKL